jgi:hypothetical protein
VIALFVVVLTITLGLSLYTGINDADIRKADEIHPGYRKAVHASMALCVVVDVVWFIYLLLTR